VSVARAGDPVRQNARDLPANAERGRPAMPNAAGSVACGRPLWTLTQERLAAYVALLGFATFIFNFVGINLFGSGLHSYSGM
jgi:hypothetical protein